jgi:hypothetical protein
MKYIIHRLHVGMASSFEFAHITRLANNVACHRADTTHRQTSAAQLVTALLNGSDHDWPLSQLSSTPVGL